MKAAIYGFVFLFIAGTVIGFNATSSSYKLKTVQSSGSVNTTTVGYTYDFISDIVYAIQNNRTVPNYYLRAGFLEVKVANIELTRNGTFFLNTTNVTRFEFNNNSFNSFNATMYDALLDALVLNSSAAGVFTSQVLNPNNVPAYSNISWASSAYGELPNERENETRFVRMDIDMQNNILLLHLNNATGESSDFFKDFSSQGNNATCTSTKCPKQNESARFMRAYSFDGSDDFINATKVNPASPFTLLAWIYPRDATWRTVMDTNGQFTAYRVLLDLDGKLTYSHNNNDGGCSNATSGTAVALNTWTHIAAVLQGDNTMKVYVNGDLENFSTISNPAVAGATDFKIGLGAAGVNVGKCMEAVPPNFDGTMDEVAVFTSRALNETEILNHYIRGATFLNFSMRLCDDPYCLAASFVDINDSPLQNISRSRNVDERWLQYQSNFTTLNTSYTPELYNVTIGYAREDHVFLNITVASVDLGNLEIGRTEDSEGKSVFFNITNEGTVPINVSAYTTTARLFESTTGGADTLPNTFFQIHANSSASGTANTTYGAVPTTLATRVRLITGLGHDRGADHGLVGIRISVPSDEEAGNKTATIVLFAEQSN